MSVIKCKPTSAGRRHVIKVIDSKLHKGNPYYPL
ncbi:50S ribosomal protein L2, partial [Buchnera aphidicola (Hormaphis cornu)]